MFIIGASTLGEIILEVAARAGERIEGFYDDVTKERNYCGVPVLGKYEGLILNPDARTRGVFVAIGDNRNRHLYSQRLLASGILLRNVIDPRAIIESSSRIGCGNLIMAGAYVGVKALIGSGNIVFPGVSITHHNEVGDFCFFSPNCSVGGYTKIGDECKIGMNCVVLPYRRLAAGTVAEPLTVAAGEAL